MNIHKLIENNQWDKIYNLIKSKKIDYNKEITNGNTILHYASIHNNNKIIKYFIDHNLDAFNNSNKEGDTPIHLLAKYGYTTLLKEVLLKNKDGVNLINNNNETVINILYNNLDFIKWIISNYKGNIKITNYNSNGDNILTKNIEESENKSDHNYGVLSLLLKKFQGKINEEDTSLLSLAIESNKDHIVDLLLQNNYDVNKKDKKFMTPLNYAIINNDYNLMVFYFYCLEQRCLILYVLTIQNNDQFDDIYKEDVVVLYHQYFLDLDHPHKSTLKLNLVLIDFF